MVAQVPVQSEKQTIRLSNGKEVEVKNFAGWYKKGECQICEKRGTDGLILKRQRLLKAVCNHCAEAYKNL